jgi:peptidoglycan hydrolase-like protein with peptidoglycan-binding domain
MVSPTGWPVMFRAGGGSGETPLPAAPAAMAPAAVGARVMCADISEFQSDIADKAYLAWSKAIIIRAMYGDQHDDRAWYGGARRAALHAGGVRFLGIYAYLVAGQDPVTQGEALVHMVGKLQPGEKLIADIEEGSGDLEETFRIWASVVGGSTGDAPWCYSGLNFAAVHGLAPVDWVAAYQGTEPSVAHELWQFTDAYQVPGVGTCDCSVFHGTIDELAGLAYGGKPVPVPPPSPPPAVNWTETLVQTLPTLAQGASGQDVRTLQGCLAARGHPVTIDGAFGPGTKTALEAFQLTKGVGTDGVAGPLTWPKLLNR